MIDNKKIIDLIPSRRLKDAINKENYQFDDYALFKIVYFSVDSVEERIDWSLYFSENSDDEEVKEIATTLYNHLKDNYLLFRTCKNDEYYNLIIKYKNKIFENIVYYDFDELMTKMQQIVLCDYVDAGYRKSDLDISIYKKKDDQEDDYESIVFINSNLNVENVFFCNDLSILKNTRIDDLVDYHFWVNIKFLSFFKDCDLVVLNGDENDLSIDNLGVVRHDTEYYYRDEFFESVAYVIRLNNSFVIENKLEEKDADGIYQSLEFHTHIPFIGLKFVDPNKLEKYEKEKYDYLTNFINKINKNCVDKDYF